jgi:BolA protein
MKDLKLLQIKSIIHENFPDATLYIEDESAQHAVKPDVISHIKIILISEAFTQVSRVNRHQQIYNLLYNNLNFKLHAIALHLFTPTEWQVKKTSALDSPQCAKK